MRAGAVDRLLAPKRLLDDWTSAYLRNYPKWHPSERYETEMSLATIREQLTDVRSNVPAWLSGEGAVEEQGMPIRSTTLMIYVSDEHRLQLNKLLCLRRSASGPVEVATAFWSPSCRRHSKTGRFRHLKSVRLWGV